MGRNAFNPAVVVDKLPVKIESVEFFENNLFIGTDQGCILRFEFDATGDVNKPIRNVQLCNTLKDFSKRPLTQLEVISSARWLVSLAEGMLTIHEMKLEEFKRKEINTPIRLLYKLDITKGAHLFAVDETNGINIAVAVKKKIMTFKIEGGKPVKKREFDVPDLAKTLTWCGLNICIGMKKEYLIYKSQNDTTIELFKTGRNGTPSVTLLNQDQMLLGRDSVSVFLGFDGKPKRNSGITWTEPPIEIGFDFPHLIGILPKFVEVRTIFENQRGGPVQMMPLKGVKFVKSRGGHVYVVSQNAVWKLFQVPVKEQVEQLIREKSYEEAIDLLENVTVDTPAAQQQTEKQLSEVRILYAYHLFSQGYYDKAMDNFIALDVDPLEVIGLYPNLLPRDLRDRYHNDQSPELTGMALEKALSALVTYLAHVRVRLPKLSAASIAEEYAQVNHLPTIVDTSLLKAYIKSQPSLAAPFLRIENYCHIKECEATLQNYKKFPELALLYRSKNLHRKALDMLEKRGRSQQGESNTGLEETINYLKSLDDTNLDCILEFSRWPLQKCPIDALRIFTEERPANHSLPPDKVLAHIKPIAPELVVPYLEWLIYEHKDTRAEFHDELIFQYLETVIALQQQSGTQVSARVKAGTEAGLLGATRKRLLNFLKESKHYHPAKMLSRFPNDLYEERAILLSRIDQHEQALKIYAHELHDFKAAEEYCSTYYNEQSEEARDVYLSLLKTYLRPPAGVNPMWGPATELLNKHFKEINAAKALQLLPPETSIKEIEGFLTNVLRCTSDKYRSSQILKSLLKSENLQVREKLIAQTAACIKVDEDTFCPVCSKRLGTSAFACYPNGKVVHLGCRKSNFICPVTGVHFGEEKK